MGDDETGLGTYERMRVRRTMKMNVVCLSERSMALRRLLNGSENKMSLDELI